MKRWLFLITGFLVFTTLVACTGQRSTGENVDLMSTDTTGKNIEEENGGDEMLVVYFSATGRTRELAEKIAGGLAAKLHEIKPQEPYTSKDLDYQSEDSRANREQNDPNSRPKIANQISNFASYQTIILAYPIWWGEAPKIIQTFLETNEVAGKTIIPVCTSGGSGIDDSVTKLRKLTANNTNWQKGTRFSYPIADNDVTKWLQEQQRFAATPSEIQVSNFDLANGRNGEAPLVELNSGYLMPIAGIGTYSLSDEECETALLSAIDSGVRLIDTAYMYHNEEAVGRAINNSGVPREDIFIITKIYPSQFADADSAINAALERLNLDYVDMMLLHHPGEGDVEAYQAMERGIKDGKIRSIGLSNWYIEELEDFLPQVDTVPALVQNEIHPYYQENEVIPYIHDLGIVVQGWYPLGGRGHTRELLTNETIVTIAENHDRSPAQIILRWNLQKGVVVIPGSSNPAHIRENISLFDFALTEDEMQAINELDRDEKHDWY